MLYLSLEPQADLKVVASVEDGQQALDNIEELHPDIALVDIEMPGMDGLTITKNICERFSNTKVLVLSGHDDEQYINKALQSGAKGYLLKNTPVEEIANAIRSVHKGYVQLGPGLWEKLVTAEVEKEDNLATDVEIADDWAQSTREAIDSLPQFWSRGILYLLVVFAAIALPWTILAKVDVIGTAKGKLEPKGKTIKLDAPVSGKVAAIKVKEGQKVKAGQSLMELESEIVRTDLQQIQAKLEGLNNRITQLKVIENQLKITNRTQQLQNQAQISEQLQEIDRAEQQLNFHQQSLEPTQQLLTKVKERLDKYRSLQKEGAISGLQVEEIEKNAIQNEQEVQKVKLNIKQAETEIKKQKSTYERIIQQGKLANSEGEKQIKQLQSQISDAQSEIAQINNQIKSLKYQWQQRVIYIPIDGTIFQLPIQNSGAVVQTGQNIAEIAPEGVPLILRAQMDSQESGFLKKGMSVKVKFDAYPFQDYGIINGQVNWISPNSKISQTDKGQVEFYELEIILDRDYIVSGNKKILLSPGQTATAEIIIQERRIIDFMLDPFKKLQKGGLQL
jgi:HlyD family secretion protein